MTEVELEYLLDVVGAEMGPAPAKGHFDGGSDFGDLLEDLPKPANDNARAWPFLPFPPGWSASC